MREREKIHGELLIKYLNEKFNKFFIVEDTEQESSETDIYACDKNNNEEIFIQNVAFRGSGLIYKKPSTIEINGKKIESNLFSNIIGVLVPQQYDKKKSIIDYISKKENKYPVELKRKLILLVEISLPTITPEDIKNYFPDGFKTDFKGLYFIQPPVILPNEDYKYDKEGFVFPLKEVQF